MHAIHCLQTFFKCNNKAFSQKSLYHPILPYFLVNPRPELVSHFLFDFVVSQSLQRDFAKKAIDEFIREPTFFYLIRNS